MSLHLKKALQIIFLKCGEGSKQNPSEKFLVPRTLVLSTGCISSRDNEILKFILKVAQSGIMQISKL
jgi:hypothetical protein